MSSRPQTPSAHNDPYGSIPNPTDPHHLSKGYGSRPNSYINAEGTGNPGIADFASHPAAGAPMETSPLGQSAPLPDELPSRPASAFMPDGSRHSGGSADLNRTDSVLSHGSQMLATPSRGGTLKKKASLKRGGSLKRSSSKRSSYAGSVRSLSLGEKERYGAGGDEEINSAFYTPVPTSGNPTEILANRFQAWRKVLKDLVAFFRDVQKAYETRAKSLLSAQNVINNTTTPPSFLASGGIADAISILRDYHKQALAEANKAKEIENDVVLQLTGLRSDLQQKIKEIKSLSGDFKNNVDKEMDGTRKTVHHLTEALGAVDLDASSVSGRGDPFIVKLGVDRQVEKQIEEENYLHRAFLNLESSGRELESIVVGEIQKAHNAYAGILKREADASYEAVDRLRSGPVSLAKDHEWDAFVERNDNMVDPRIPLRHVESIFYPGKFHPSAAEVRSGMLERKSKYLKSYTPGWYVLSPTHLHEFKSADRISSQAPVMSLYLPEQKLGSHSQPDSSSHKFMLKGRQTGSMHRGHAWVFRAESHDTMLQWFEDIKSLTEKRGEDRNAFVRKHARSLSAGSQRPGSISSDAMEEDEADATPYSANASVTQSHRDPQENLDRRPSPGGRFPSDIQVNRDLQVPLSPSSGESSGDRDIMAAAGNLPGSGVPFGTSGQPVPERDPHHTAPGDGAGETHPTSATPQRPFSYVDGAPSNHHEIPHLPMRQNSANYGEWMAPAAVGAGGAVVGAAAGLRERRHEREQKEFEQQQQQSQSNPVAANGSPLTYGPTTGSDAPIPTDSPRVVTTSEPSQTDSLSTVPTSVGSEEMAAMAARQASNKNSADQHLARPVTQSRHQSSTTISDLHIPGQYPRTPTMSTS